jgi:hypothetical protein
MPPNCRRVANAKMGLHPRFDRRSTSFKARNGVGARPDGKVIFAVSEGEVSFDAFARLFRDGLNCPNALFSTGAAPRACTRPRSTAMAASCRLARCWRYSREIEAQVGINQNRNAEPFRLFDSLMSSATLADVEPSRDVSATV